MNIWVLFYQLLPVTLALFAVMLMILSPTPRQLGLSIKWGALTLVLSIIYDLITVNLGIWTYQMDEMIWNIPLPIYFLSFLIYGSIVYIGALKIYQHAPITFWLLIISIPTLGVIRDYWGGVHLAPDLITWQTSWWFVFDLIGWSFAYVLPIVPLLRENKKREEGGAPKGTLRVEERERNA